MAAYVPGLLGVHAVEYRAVVWEVKKVACICDMSIMLEDAPCECECPDMSMLIREEQNSGRDEQPKIYKKDGGRFLRGSPRKQSLRVGDAEYCYTRDIR